MESNPQNISVKTTISLTIGGSLFELTKVEARKIRDLLNVALDEPQIIDFTKPTTPWIKPPYPGISPPMQYRGTAMEFNKDTVVATREP